MLAAALIVIGIALVDSLNPSTIGAALVLALSARPVPRILQFAAGFLLVNVAAGVLLVLGPGQWLLSLVPDVSDNLKHAGAVGAGVALLVATWVLLAAHGWLTRPRPETTLRAPAGSEFLFGAALAVAALPTAFPYFAAIAAIVAADLSLAGSLVLVVVFNLIFVAPVFAIAALIELFPSTWQRFADPFKRWISAHWPRVLAVILAAGGVALLVFGLAGLSS